MRYKSIPLLGTTGLVCAVEIAALAAALRHNLPVASTALLLCSFHCGYLAADRLGALMRSDRLVLLLAGSMCVTALSLSSLHPGLPFLLVAAALFAFNSSAQAVRRSLKISAPVGSIAKNAAKATGMIAGGFLGWTADGPLILLTGAVLLLAADVELPERPVQLREKVPRDATDRLMLAGEFMHHAHYFAYCATFWWLAPSVLGPGLGIWFVVGWLAYFVAERVWRERQKVFAPGVISAGHFLVSGALVMMLYVNSAGVMLAWFLTGIGGGTAYMLGNAGAAGPRETFEDAGHVAGLLIAAAASLSLSSRNGARVDVLAAAAMAALTSIIFLTVRCRRRTSSTAKGRVSNASS